MSWLRTLMLLALIVWIGGIIFFAFVLAPTVFSVLPTRDLAGDVVNPSLLRLHWMGLASGIIFLTCSLVYNQVLRAQLRTFSGSHLLVTAMLVLTAASLFGVTPRMSSLRQDMGVIDNVRFDDPRRIEFNRLHEWSTWLEGGVLFCGLGLVALTARRFGKGNN
jgi:uncharacterized membrane protein YhhN